jgi:hypothetical protein
MLTFLRTSGLVSITCIWSEDVTNVENVAHKKSWTTHAFSVCILSRSQYYNASHFLINEKQNENILPLRDFELDSALARRHLKVTTLEILNKVRLSVHFRRLAVTQPWRNTPDTLAVSHCHLKHIYFEPKLSMHSLTTTVQQKFERFHGLELPFLWS